MHRSHHSHSKTSHGESGFMIIGIAILLVVFSLMLAAYVNLTRMNTLKRDNAVTTNSIAATMNKLSLYVSSNGHLPCPARRNLTAASADFGVATSCADISVAPGNCPATQAYCVAQNGTHRIRIGIVPFKTLKLDKKEAMDAYGNFLLYAVTERQTSSASLQENGGQIILQNRDENGATTSRNVDFVLISHGKDRRGGFTLEGLQPAACAAGRRDQENCDNDATFLIAPHAPTQTAAHFDDRVEYSLLDWVYIWDMPGSTTENSYSRGPMDSFIGVGTNTPQDKLHVGNGGNLRIQNGSLNTRQLCQFNGTFCFDPRRLGGNVANGHGMQCPADRVMIDIRNGGPVCGTFAAPVTNNCPANSFYAGTSYSGGNLVIRCTNALTGASSNIAIH